MHSLDHEIEIAATPAAVFSALTTAAGLQGWFSTGAAGSGEPGMSWDVTFPASSARFVWEVDASQLDLFVAWRCLEGPGDSVGTTATFRLETVGDATKVHFVHGGWPHTAGNFDRCNTLWGGLLHHLKAYVESGVAAPLYA